MIKKPNELDYTNKNIIMIISGLPGTGKTTLALSAPGVLLIDADEGLCRVNPAHRRDSSTCQTYEELLEDLKAAEGAYQTIAIDTCGALIDLLKDWAVRTDPKASKASGGISLQGFGTVKTEFLRLSADLRKKFNVIFLFHEQVERAGDETVYSLLCEGAARSLVYQPADLAGHLQIINGERYIGFTPTASYTAKSAYGIKGLIKIPELAEGEPNDFLSKLFEQVKANIAAEKAAYEPQADAYAKAMSDGKVVVESIEKPEDVPVALRAIESIAHALTSKKELQAAVKAKMAQKGITYDKAAKAYVYAQA